MHFSERQEKGETEAYVGWRRERNTGHLTNKPLVRRMRQEQPEPLGESEARQTLVRERK